MFLRLRQICFVAEDLASVENDLVAVLGLSPCHRDPRIASFGLENVLMPVGPSSFFEIVSPIAAGTTAGRYLERRSGDGGYMAIFDSDELDRWREHIAVNGVREAALLEFDGFTSLQMHPRDTGGPLLEINCTVGGADVLGNYGPAGSHWQKQVRMSRVQGLLGVEIQSENPEKLARRWATILMRDEPVPFEGEWHVTVDNAVLRFVGTGDERGEGLRGIDLEVHDTAPILDAAHRRKLAMEGSMVCIGGVRCYLHNRK